MPSTEAMKNDLARRVSKLSRRVGSPINAYHARGDIDELMRRGFQFEELTPIYERHYGETLPA
jgi:hypothetical protein